MSLDPPAPPAVDAAPRESAAWVLGIGLGLALIAACVVGLVLVRARPVDAAAALAGSFELAALPFGMRLESALELSGGEVVVLIRDERELGFDPERELAAGDDDDDEAPPGSADEAAVERGEAIEGAAAVEEKIDWAALEELEPGGPPARLYLVRYEESAAKAALDRSFRRLEWKDLSELDAQGGRVAVEGGKLDWGPFAADYVRERRFLPEPTFGDSVRVNLALPDRYWIAYAFWPRGHAGSKEPVEKLLAALPPVDPYQD